MVGNRLLTGNLTVQKRNNKRRRKMTAKNDNTGDLIYSCPTSKAYRDNFDAIFKKDIGIERSEAEALDLGSRLNAMNLKKTFDEIYQEGYSFEACCIAFAESRYPELTEKKVKEIIRASGCLPEVMRLMRDKK